MDELEVGWLAVRTLRNGRYGHRGGRVSPLFEGDVESPVTGQMAKCGPHGPGGREAITLVCQYAGGGPWLPAGANWPLSGRGAPYFYEQDPGDDQTDGQADQRAGRQDEGAARPACG
jgi:hypothetical protein